MSLNKQRSVAHLGHVFPGLNTQGTFIGNSFSKEELESLKIGLSGHSISFRSPDENQLKKLKTGDDTKRSGESLDYSMSTDHDLGSLRSSVITVRDSIQTKNLVSPQAKSLEKGQYNNLFPERDTDGSHDFNESCNTSTRSNLIYLKRSAAKNSLQSPLTTEESTAMAEFLEFDNRGIDRNGGLFGVQTQSW